MKRAQITGDGFTRTGTRTRLSGNEEERECVWQWRNWPYRCGGQGGGGAHRVGQRKRTSLPRGTRGSPTVVAGRRRGLRAREGFAAGDQLRGKDLNLTGHRNGSG